MLSFSKKSIRFQFKLVFSCLIALGLGLSLLAYFVLGRLTAESAATYAQSVSQRFSYELSFLLQRTDAVFNSLLIDQNLEELMKDPYTEKTPDLLNALRTKFSAFSLMNPDLADIAYVTPEMSSSNYFSDETLHEYAGRIEGHYDTVCLGIHSGSLITLADKSKFLILGKNVYGMHDMEVYRKHLGCVILSLDLTHSTFTLPADKQNDSRFILTDGEGGAFLFNCTPEEYDGIVEQSLSAGEGEWPSEGSFYTKDYLIYRSEVKNSGLSLICAMSRRELYREARRTALGLAAVSGAALVMIGVLMYSVSVSVVNPLGKLYNFINRIRRNPADASGSALSPEGCAEVRSVSAAFNAMLREQTRLSKELREASVSLYQTELGLKQAELDFLRSQINPHFLYNALEAIQAVAAADGQTEIENAAGALGTLFRYNVKGKATVTLKQEMEITNAYLTIQKLRFGDKIEVIGNLRADTEELMVIKLLLQPIVENAVYHGLEPKVGSGTIFISSRREGGDLLISVYDNGVGIPAERLRKLQKALSNAADGRRVIEKHIGLLNVQYRLRLFYGSPYGIHIESKENEGTKVLIRLPARSIEEEEALSRKRPAFGAPLDEMIAEKNSSGPGADSKKQER